VLKSNTLNAHHERGDAPISVVAVIVLPSAAADQFLWPARQARISNVILYCPETPWPMTHAEMTQVGSDRKTDSQ
jgi:hypothetical protein